MRKIFSKTAFFRSIQWRLVLILMLTTFVLMSVVWVFLNARVENIFYEDFKTNIETNYNALNVNEENTEYQKLLKDLKENPLIAGFIHGTDKSYTILDKSTAEVLFTSDVLYQKDKLQFRNEIFKSENLLYVLSQNDPDAVGNKQQYTKSESGDFYDYVKTQRLNDGEYVLFLIIILVSSTILWH